MDIQSKVMTYNIFHKLCKCFEETCDSVMIDMRSMSVCVFEKGKKKHLILFNHHFLNTANDVRFDYMRSLNAICQALRLLKREKKTPDRQGV